MSRLGADAIAGVGLTESLLTLVYTVAVGLSIGVTAMVARRTGEKDPDAASRTTAQSILLGLAVAAVLGVIGVLNASRFLGWMGGSEEVIAAGSTYATIMLGSNSVILLLFLINAGFRGAGDATIAMRVLWIANTINLILDPLLIFGIGPFPELGVAGAAVSTVIGRGTAVCIQLATLFGGIGRVTLTWAHLRPDFHIMWRLVRL